MSKTTIKYNDSGRLVYLEPNNITTVNGVPVTPDYTDFCLMFRLVADVVNRMDVIGVDGSSNLHEKMAITWISQLKSGKGEKVYFTRGSKVGDSDRTYLTTFYTDVSYRDFSDKDIVEGLGVESIDIAIENFYVATVKIKFVDTRGASLFGREEAIHKNTKLTSNDMYGCFFTMPYPKFTLQVKGFYGKAMTLQLTCTDFRGSFDSNTGNFVADVTFVGYDFSCFSDLPLRYVLLSPIDNEIGRKYWEDNAKNNPNWKLKGPDGQEDPQMLIDVYKRVKSAVNGGADFNVDDYVEDTEMIEATETLESLSKLKTVYDEIFSSNVFENLKATYPFTLKTIYYTAFDANNQSMTFTGNTDLVMTSDERQIELFSTPVQPDFSKLFSAIDEYNRLTSSEPFEYNKEKFEYVELSFAENGGLYEKTFTFDDGGLYSEIKSRIGELDNIISSSQTYVGDSGTNKKIKDMLLFTPYVGNVIKLLLCHVETFIYTVYMAASNIYDQMNRGERTGKKLGLNITNSDISRLSVLNIQRFGGGNVQIPPFPSIIVTDKTTGDNSDFNAFGFERNGWPGDLDESKSEWEEYRLIKGYTEASQRNGSDDVSVVKDNGSDDMSDLLCAEYIFFKNLWDRWLVSGNINDFTVESMYKDFVFVDSFFRDISYKLHINVDVLLSCLESRTENNTVYSMLRTLANQHNCMFFSYSDTMSFTSGFSRNNEGAKKNIEKMFTPVPYKDVEDMSTTNKVVFMYHNKPANSTTNETDGFADDNMYFTDGNNFTPFANKAFASANNGYVVPSFCVTYSKLSNTFFTNFAINMNVPTTTSQTAATAEQIGRMYSASKRKVSFYGQDLYPVFSNYSYICEFDMLGDMQITPLMYFQLFNVPMFRGVYMIFSVKHTMKQGNMITHVKGMRMSREAIPFPKKWFSDNFEEIFKKTGVIGQWFTYESPQEVVLDTEFCNKYKTASMEDVISFVIDFNGGYYSTTDTRLWTGEKYKPCYCNIVDNLKESERNSSIDEKDTPETKLWKTLYSEVGVTNLQDGEIVDNEHVKEYVKEYYSNLYKERAKLDGVGNGPIQAFILINKTIRPDMRACYEAANEVFNSGFNVGTNDSINSELKTVINSNDKKKYSDMLAKTLKYEYGKTKKDELKTYLLDMIDRSIVKINEKWCNDN